MDEKIKKLVDQYNNYVYPKPCEDINSEWIFKKKFLQGDPNYHWHKLWPERPYSREKMNILVAGCGANQAAILAKCNPIHNFIGIDLSQESINHHIKLKKNFKIDNLKLFCGDFRNQTFEFDFDYIISTGVIHHLEDPNSALKYFNDLLKDHGVLYLMVYGNRESSGIQGLKDTFKKLELSQNKESINNIKNLVSKLDKNHPSRIFIDQFADFNYEAGVVDLFLHPQEKFYSLKELMKDLGDNNFVIKNFIDGKVAAASKYFINNTILHDKFKKLTIEDQLNISQILNWKDRKIEVICTKNHNRKYSRYYSKLDFDTIFIYQFEFIDYIFYKESVEIKNMKDGKNFKFNFDNKKIDWQRILSGQDKLKKHTHMMDKIEKENFFKVIEFLIENYLLDYSFHKIEDYKKFYNTI
jgi:SAM-dependent methyltransferase